MTQKTHDRFEKCLETTQGEFKQGKVRACTEGGREDLGMEGQRLEKILYIVKAKKVVIIFSP